MSSTPRTKHKKTLGDTPVGREAQFLDQTLRPTTWNEYVGQKHIKDNVAILLAAARGRGHAPEHLLFHGPPGLGKTTLAHLIAHETGAQMRATSGPAIERVGDLASILTNLSPGDILFIDEVHRLNKIIEEVLYPAMETGALDIIIGKGPSARTIQLELPPFTLIAATTRIALLSGPLRSRFSGGTFKLNYYTEGEIQSILERSARLLGIPDDGEALIEIAKRSRATPRTANYLLKRARDFAQVEKLPFSRKTVSQALVLLGVDDVGLFPSDRVVIETIIDKFDGGPVGLTTLASATSDDAATIEEVYEPYLMQLGFLERTPRGRIVTKRGYKHLGKRTLNAQEKLL
ncbi:Holliday junction branch migration DNA helicase RuvB [Candidatus Wolfebacteria bacterium]|nr:Holliday junction branch migration DNA helicase RuvB [Candidatus Wolfebacteria bacterium]